MPYEINIDSRVAEIIKKNKTLGSFIKKERKRIKVNQETLGSMAGASKDDVSSWERNIYPPAKEEVLRLAGLFEKNSFILFRLREKTKYKADGPDE